MGTNIKISVVVPVYNVHEYLVKCIESIINQTYRNIELILVDDGSTDGSSEICDYYATEDNRICVIHKKNGGLVSARKAGTAAATGDYILNVDGDDWIDEDRIEDLVLKGIQIADADMVYMHGYILEYEKYRKIKYCEALEQKTYYEDDIEKQIFPLMCGGGESFFVNRMAYNTVCWAVKSELIKEKQQCIDDRIKVGEDLYLTWNCLLAAKHATVINQKGYHYVQRDSSIVHRTLSNSYRCIEDYNIIYHGQKLLIERYAVNPKETMKILCRILIKNLLFCDYKALLIKNMGYLYPFSEVKKGSRIVVYGAGMMGISLMRCLVHSNNYNVVLWVDQNVNKSPLPEFEISSVKDIEQMDYDYVIIAIADTKISYEVKENLIGMGISKEKVARIDSNVITEDALPDEVLGEECNACSMIKN